MEYHYTGIVKTIASASNKENTWGKRKFRKSFSSKYFFICFKQIDKLLCIAYNILKKIYVINTMSKVKQ